MSVFTEETCLYVVIHQFGMSIPIMAYKTFLFVPDSLKLGRACSSDVYSVLRTKAEIIFDSLCHSREALIIILVHAPTPAMLSLL